MASERDSSMSSAFDDMLEQNRKELDGMYSGSTRSSKPSRAPSEARGPSFPDSDFESRTTDQAPPARSMVQQLNLRFGDKWRYEITNRQRDGDEVVVLCKLMLSDQRVAKAQFGRARIRRAGSGSSVQGSAGGVSFSLGASGTNSLSGDTEDAAYDRAIEDALTKCSAML